MSEGERTNKRGGRQREPLQWFLEDQETGLYDPHGPMHATIGEARAWLAENSEVDQTYHAMRRAQTATTKAPARPVVTFEAPS